jgi:uncharacterized protein (DUF4415 family)
MPYKMTKSERRARLNWARDQFVLDAIELEIDMPDRLPHEWKMIALDLDVTEKKEKVTLYLDRSVARMYRGLGQGYQGVINRVLRVWMQCKTANWLDDEVMVLKDRQDRIFAKQLMSGESYRDWPGYDENVMDWAEERLGERE